jgi:hypothetical protein
MTAENDDVSFRGIWVGFDNNKHFRCLLFSFSETSRLVYVEVSMLPTIDSNSKRVCL